MAASSSLCRFGRGGDRVCRDSGIVHELAQPTTPRPRAGSRFPPDARRDLLADIAPLDGLRTSYLLTTGSWAIRMNTLDRLRRPARAARRALRLR